MKKFPFSLSLSFSLITVIVIAFVSCKNELDISYSMSGDWYAEYAAQDNVANGEYSRVVQAYHFDGNGTGYWYKFLLPADSEEPIDMYGGHVFGTFTYTMGDEGVLNIHLDKDISGTERTRQLAYGEGTMDGTDNDGDYALQRATEAQMLWCRYWDETMNGGSSLVGLWLGVENYRDNTALRMQWATGDKMVMGSINANNQSSMSDIPVVSISDLTFILSSYLSSFAKDKPIWAATGVDDVSVSYKDNEEASSSFPVPPSLTLQCTVPAAYNSELYGQTKQIITVPMVGYSATMGDTLQLQNICAAVKLNLTNATPNPVVVDEVILTSDNYRLNGQIELRDFDGKIPNLQPQTTTTKAQRTMTLTFGQGKFTSFQINGGEMHTIFVPVLPTGDDNFTVEMRCHPVLPEGVPSTTYSYTYSNKVNLPAMERNTTQSIDISLSFANPDFTSTGSFSVSDDKAVYFAKANLTAHCEEFGTDPHVDLGHWKRWTFALLKDQTSMVETNGGMADTYNDTPDMSLFSYGCTGYYNGQTCWKPNSTMWEHRTGWDDYTNCWWFYNEDLTGTADWGYNAIIGAGNKENSGWRTLSSKEWEYLLRWRKGHAEKYGLATVKGVKGLILLPDIWTQPTGCKWAAQAMHYADNTYNDDQWEQMESAGAIFLPAAGTRIFEVGYVNWLVKVQGVQDEGRYWSTTQVGDKWADFLYFYEDNVSLGNMGKHDGAAVRLVRDM